MTTIGETFQGHVCFEQTKLGQPYEYDARAVDRLYPSGESGRRIRWRW
jgi:hypothetical protein